MLFIATTVRAGGGGRWDFHEADDGVRVTLVVGSRPYTYERTGVHSSATSAAALRPVPRMSIATVSSPSVEAGLWRRPGASIRSRGFAPVA
jgi:hypothetical protein